MNLTKTIAVALALTICGLASTSTLAQSLAAADKAPEMISGEIRKIDTTTGKLTIKHGPIKHLDMPPMTMVFHAGDKSSLEQLKVGDKIEFSVASEQGKMTVTSIKRAQP